MYFRNSNTSRSGGAFSDSVVLAVWQKATIVPGYDSRQIRKDRCGAWIRYADYGTTGDFGWEIDHDFPVALGGGDDLSNLRPLQWHNNRHKGDSYPTWTCALIAR